MSLLITAPLQKSANPSAEEAGAQCADTENCGITAWDEVTTLSSIYANMDHGLESGHYIIWG